MMTALDMIAIVAESTFDHRSAKTLSIDFMFGIMLLNRIGSLHVDLPKFETTIAIPFESLTTFMFTGPTRSR